MPAATGTKRVKLVSIMRPFVFGSVARPIDPNDKPNNLPDDHTHQWTVFIKGINDVDISYWLKKVQFKLHDTYPNALRTKESAPFEITETGWGEFEIGIKLFFVPEACEKPQMIWHTLKLHPFGPDADAQRERRDLIVSQNYEEIQFNEPTEALFDILTGGGSAATPKSKGKGGKGGRQPVTGKSGVSNSRTAELPEKDTPGNPYSRDAEGREIDRLILARKTVDEQIEKERAELEEKQADTARLKAELKLLDAAVATK